MHTINGDVMGKFIIKELNKASRVDRKEGVEENRDLFIYREKRHVGFLRTEVCSVFAVNAARH